MRKIIVLFIACVFGVFFGMTQVYGANMPLEIMNLKPAGTGTPVLTASHRYFFAYPGIEYKIRAQVVGGDYPYTYELINEPAGMSIDSAGYIRWENPTSDANNITISVTDSSGTEVSSFWSIDVTNDVFRFVDINAAPGGDGTIENPFDSIEAMTENVLSTDIVYFRKGTYAVPVRGDHTINSASAFKWDYPRNTSVQWIAYPDENVTMDLGGDKYFYNRVAGQPFYFDGLRFYRGREYFFRSGSALTYVTFLDNTFEDLTLERENYNSNQGTYFTMYGGRGYNMAWQGNTFSGFRGTQGIGSLYDQDTTLIEDNYFTDFSGYAGSTNQVFAFKIGIVNLTLRGNVVNLGMDDDFSIFGGTSLNSGFVDGDGVHGPRSQNIEILYNYFRHDGSCMGQLNRGHQADTWVHRNTFVSTFQMTNLVEGSCDGPFIINDNIFQNSDAGIRYHYTCSGDYLGCVSQEGNIGAVNGLVDEDGLLLESSDIGQLGWQFSDGTTPRDLGGDVQPISVPEPVIIRADVNQDKSIDLVDARMIFRNILGFPMSGTDWQDSSTSGDVNCDGRVDLRDAMLTFRESVGLSMSGTAWCVQ